MSNGYKQYDQRQTENLKWTWHQEPTEEQIISSLQTVPAWRGSSKTLAEYADYVFPIKNSGTYKIYMSVAGRIVIFRDALGDDAFEENVEVLEDRTNQKVLVRGTLKCKLGTAFECATGKHGGKGADLYNAIENAITSWRGRAIAAVSAIGIIPGSGITTMEDINTLNYAEEHGLTSVSMAGMMEYTQSVGNNNDDEKQAQGEEKSKAMAEVVTASLSRAGIELSDEKTNSIITQVLGVDVSGKTIDKQYLLTLSMQQLLALHKEISSKYSSSGDKKDG